MKSIFSTTNYSNFKPLTEKILLFVLSPMLRIIYNISYLTLSKKPHCHRIKTEKRQCLFFLNNIIKNIYYKKNHTWQQAIKLGDIFTGISIISKLLTSPDWVTDGVTRPAILALIGWTIPKT